MFWQLSVSLVIVKCGCGLRAESDGSFAQISLPDYIIEQTTDEQGTHRKATTLVDR